MLRRLGSHVRNQWMGALALFLVLTGGVAYAANTIGSSDIIDESILSQDLKNGQVKTADIGNNQVQSADVRDDTLAGGGLTGADVKESSLNLAAEGWHEVGTPGEPPFFDDDLTSCLWKNYDGGVSHNSAGFLRNRHGFVHLKGMVDTEGECRFGLVEEQQRIFTLPDGYRPAKREIRVAIGAPIGESGIVRINVNGPAAFGQDAGAVSYDPQSQANFTEWVSLDGITFRCAPSGQNGCP